MSVSQQANGSTPYASRRRRRGGRGGGSGSSNRGDPRPTLWQEGNSRAGSLDRGDSGDGGKQQNGVGSLNVASRSKGKTNGGGVGGRQGKESPPEEEEESVHPAMLESEFLASTNQADADASGVALSLEEVPYDRDLRWCNMSSSSRPRPMMDTISGVFGRVGASITQDTGDYERLDRHYQELWKDREGNGPPAPSRGRGNRGGRGGRTRGRGSNGGGNGGGPQRSSTPNGSGREDVTRHGTLSKRNRGGGGRTGGRGGRGAGNRIPAEKSGESAVGGRSGGQRGVASSLHSNGGGGGGGGAGVSTVAQRRGQRGGGSSMGRSGGGGRSGAVAACKVVAHSSPGSSLRNPQSVMAPAFRGQESTAVTTATMRAPTQVIVASVPSWQGRVGGGSPARAASNGHHGWEGTDQRALQLPTNQHQHHPLTPGFGPWVMEPGQSLSPVEPTGFARAPDGGTVVIRTPPLIPSMSPMIGGRRPDSPEYLGDLANALSAAPFAGRTSEEPSESIELTNQPIMRQQQQRNSLAVSMSSPLGPELLGASTVDDRNSFGGHGGIGGGGGGGGGITAAQNGGAALSPYMSPRRSKTSPGIRAMANPSLEFDIQDICADPDLNVNAPAFVPGGYLST